MGCSLRDFVSRKARVEGCIGRQEKASLRKDPCVGPLPTSSNNFENFDEPDPGLQKLPCTDNAQIEGQQVVQPKDEGERILSPVPNQQQVESCVW